MNLRMDASHIFLNLLSCQDVTQSGSQQISFFFLVILTVQRLDGTMLLLPIRFEQSSVEHTTKMTWRLQQCVSQS